MPAYSWKSGYDYCSATNRNGEKCGNKVPRGFRLCVVHRRVAEREIVEHRDPVSPESPCAICRSYGHFTHNHPPRPT